MAYEDLLKDTSQSFEDGNYFIVTVPDLTPGTIYPLEFRWKYKDGTFSEWGCVKTITAAPESTPKKPSLTAEYFQGIITVKWDGKGFDSASYTTVIDRVEIYLQNVNIGTYFPKGSIQYNNGVGGTLSIPVEPATYKVRGRAISKGSLESIYSDEITVTAKLDAPVQVTTVNSLWAGSDFTITFNHDPSSAENKWLSYYLVTLTSGSDTKTFNLLPISGTTQKFSMSLASNRAAFGVPKTSFSGSVQTVDIYGNIGTAATFGSVAYVNTLAAPVLTGTEIVQGYSIAYTTPTSATYDHIEIEEVESSAGTAPSTGYSTIFSGVANPAQITRPNQNKRWVRARFADNIGSFSGYSTAIAVTPQSPVVADNIPPAAPSSGSVTPGVDNSSGSSVGFNAYLDIVWTAVSDSSLKGYRIRFRKNGSSDPYSYVDSPGTGTSFRLTGLAIGTVYEVGIASYDEYNNTTSSYTSLGTGQATGNPYIGKTVDVEGYFSAKANSGDAASTAFKFGYGVDTGKRGLVFNTNNYWYIDSAQAATFKLGGDTNNYIQWDGSSFIVQGDLRAKKGNFSGNVEIQSGGSLYSGTLNQAGSLTGSGFILNNSGLTFNSSSVNGITTINGTTGLFTTTSANIGGWDVTSSAISKTSSSGTITLNSANAQITLGSTSYTAGIATPDTNSSTDIVFWAGGARNTSANFYVRADGTVKMSSAIITGYATQASLDSTNTTVSNKADTSTVNTQLANKVSAGGAAADVNNYTTTILGDRIRTGTIQGNSYSYTGTYNPFSDSGTAIDLTNNIIRSPQFAIVGGSAYFKGQLSAATGSFNGSVTASTFNLTAGSDFWKSDGSFQFGGSDGITKSTTGAIAIGSNVVISGNITANAVSTTNLNIFSTGRIYNSGGFEVTAAGKLTATGADIDGKITGTSGRIGSWNINADGSIYNGTTYFYGSSVDTNNNPNYWAIFDLYKSAYFKGLVAGTDGIQSQGGDVILSNSADLGLFNGSNIYLGVPALTVIYANGTIYANTLGTGSGLAIHQVQSGTNAGYLKVNTSTIRHKENIVSIDKTNYINIIDQLNPVTFQYKKEIDPEQPINVGLVAEDLENIPGLEKLVVYGADGLPIGISYDKLPVFLILALKEIKERLDALEG